ncbi:biotin-independent malonate decarboxylase subunit gamma [Sapientia aquatica]|uniref:Biotin-independent malonate decarboxylase subunit gamma n=1 Tax=Sapientia aquatica TaxID=1549640 RepID=A0A4R5W451_9BURK|nr:biotin-independent malonate decarboxylase subunit gamma [Sapientia aquatica]TDK67529.1 biotin-independent malonate decarboxylase subunit gamma [Sapientia aquatica]
MSATNSHINSLRGATWLQALIGAAAIRTDFPASIKVSDAQLNGQSVRYIAVIPDAENAFVRARTGEVGLVEGWQLARAVQEVIDADAADAANSVKTPIIAIVDVASQAYGRREEAYGIHQALAAAAGAYASARLAGHPVIALIVGKAMSGAFLAHGYQANRLIALDDAQVMVHAMGKESAARITLRSVESLEALAETIPPMAYDIRNFASLGLLWKSLQIADPDQPDLASVDLVKQTLHEALESIRSETVHDLSGRLGAPHRAASARVRELLAQQWNS